MGWHNSVRNTIQFLCLYPHISQTHCCQAGTMSNLAHKIVTLGSKQKIKQNFLAVFSSVTVTKEALYSRLCNTWWWRLHHPGSPRDYRSQPSCQTVWKINVIKKTYFQFIQGTFWDCLLLRLTWIYTLLSGNQRYKLKVKSPRFKYQICYI